MVNKQSNTNEIIAKAMAEAARVTIQAMAAAGAQSTQNVGPRMGRPIMKQPTFNWEAKDKYDELKNFGLQNFIACHRQNR